MVHFKTWLLLLYMLIICLYSQNQELKERIERLASLHEERVFNLTYLNSTTEKYEQEIDILTTRNTEQNMNINEQEEEEIIKLENELNRKKEETYLLNRKKQDHIKMRNDIKQLKLKNSTNVNYKKRIENIERLENDIHAKKKRIHDYNDILTTMDQDSNVVNNIQTMSSTREIYTGFRARIEKLITSQPIVKDKENNIKELISLFKSIQTELKEILEGLSVFQSTETYVNTTRSIYKGILTYIQKVIESENTTNTIDLEQFNSLIQHNTHTTIPTLEVSKEAIIITPILLKLFNEKQVKLSALTTFVEELAKKHNLTERQAIQSIYKLVAADLVVIDRTHKDSLVKLKLLL